MVAQNAQFRGAFSRSGRSRKEDEWSKAPPQFPGGGPARADDARQPPADPSADGADERRDRQPEQREHAAHQDDERGAGGDEPRGTGQRRRREEDVGQHPQHRERADQTRSGADAGAVARRSLGQVAGEESAETDSSEPVCQ